MMCPAKKKIFRPVEDVSAENSGPRTVPVRSSGKCAKMLERIQRAPVVERAASRGRLAVCGRADREPSRFAAATKATASWDFRSRGTNGQHFSDARGYSGELEHAYVLRAGDGSRSAVGHAPIEHSQTRVYSPARVTDAGIGRCMNPRRWLHEHSLKLLAIRDTPEAIAGGVAIGLFF